MRHSLPRRRDADIFVGNSERPALPFKNGTVSRYYLENYSVRLGQRRFRNCARWRGPSLIMAACCLLASLGALTVTSPETQAEIHEQVPEIILHLKGLDPMPPVFAAASPGLLASSGGPTEFR
ncbi:hypothetical protein [Haloferula helveola]|uniref:hypothetical protein n=1 Tax=Haloferula helveola TaxID=490095 RepID=UPI0030CE7E12